MLKRRELIQGAASAALAGAAPAAESSAHAAGPLIAASSKTVVETESGRVRGFVNRGVWVFRGIPYAEPAGGANRFLPPVKNKPWAGVRSCLTYGPSCPSGVNISENGDNSTRGDEDNFLLYRTGGWTRGEDCLRLNVWSPGPGGRKRPVMVFMHGGGYVGGSGNDLLSYDGENLARFHDVVVVTHNRWRKRIAIGACCWFIAIILVVHGISIWASASAPVLSDSSIAVNLPWLLGPSHQAALSIRAGASSCQL